MNGPEGESNKYQISDVICMLYYEFITLIIFANANALNSPVVRIHEIF